jgi:hypothetical protein
MNQKTVSQLDVAGYFVGPAEADESPLEPGVFLLPAGAVDAPPPSVPEGFRAKWENNIFVLEQVIPPEPPPPAIPASVTMRQARLALHRAGLLTQVNSTITDPEAQIEWEYATTVERNSPLVQNLAAGLGLTEQQLDDLFTTAATL